MTVYVVFSGHDCEDWGMDKIFATRADAERYRDELLAEAEEDDESLGDMTNEEYDAKIDAATEAMMDPTMPEEMFKKGLEYINKLAKKKRQSRLERVRKWDPEVINRCGWKIVEQMEARERQEREDFINNRTK